MFEIKSRLISFLILLGLFLDVAAKELPRYSYCSNGNCMVITNDFFHKRRGMPLDLSFVCNKDNQYALTFDDGPSENYNKLLDILNKHNVKATFFVNAQNIGHGTVESLKRAYSDGHDIANHTLSHIDLTSSEYSEAEVLSEIRDNREIMLNHLDENRLSSRLDLSTRIVRPPYGNIDKRVDRIFKENNYYAVRWNGDRYDWNLNDDDVDVIYNRIIQQLDFIELYYSRGHIDTNAIMDLNHDFRTATLHALDKAIPIIKQKGYSFVTITECLGL